jgi:Tfp pilus assembly protein PilO
MKQNTKRFSSIIFSLLFVVVALVIFFDLIQPAYGDLQAAKGQEEGEQQLLASEQQIATQVQTLLTQYKSQGQDIALANEALPVGPDLANALAQVYGIAGANGISVTGISISQTAAPAQAGNGSGGNSLAGAASTGQLVTPLSTLSFNLTASGSYENLQAFLHGLETNLRIFDVQSLSIQPNTQGTGKGGSQDFFRYSITVQTYYE